MVDEGSCCLCLGCLGWGCSCRFVCLLVYVDVVLFALSCLKGSLWLVVRLGVFVCFCGSCHVGVFLYVLVLLGCVFCIACLFLNVSVLVVVLLGWGCCSCVLCLPVCVVCCVDYFCLTVRCDC